MNQRLWRAAKENSVATCREVLNYHMRGDVCAQVNAKSENDWTALHIAADEGSTDVCKVLIEYALEVDLNACTNLNQTPLHLAAEKGFLDIVQLLINSGADINMQDCFGRTALHLVAVYNHVETATLLLGKDPQVDIKDRNFRTAYQSASSQAVAEVFELYYTQRQIPFSKRRNLPGGPPSPSRQDQIDRLLLKAQTAATPRALEVFYDRAQRPVYDIMSSARWKGEVDETEFPHAEYSDFELICLLGRGAFAEVYLVEKTETGQKYAMKVLSKDRIIGQNLMKYAVAERNVLTYISHPFIVGLNFAFQTQEKLVLIMDYCAGGDLSRVLRREKKYEIYRLSEERAKWFLCEILLAIEELHSHDIVYRDLKPDNVVLDAEGHALLTDFGLSKEGVRSTTRAQSFCGTMCYLAPEMLRHSGHSKTVDYYMMGTLLYEMLMGAPPFYSRDVQEMVSSVLEQRVAVPAFVSPRAADLIGRLMEKDPDKRLGAGPSGIAEIKSHRFFEGVDWVSVYNRECSPGPVEVQQIRSGIILSPEEVFGVLSPPNEVQDPLRGWSFIQPALSSQSFHIS